MHQFYAWTKCISEQLKLNKPLDNVTVFFCSVLDVNTI